MDSKHMQTGVLIAFLAVIMIVSIVLIANWDNISGGRKNYTSTQTTSSSVNNEKEITSDEGGRQIGNDLSAWKKDDSFFDSAKSVEEIENRIITEKMPDKTGDNESNR